MRLTITTPLHVIVDQEDVASVRAEDETGSFVILPGHAEFLTTLAVSVVTWRVGADEHRVAVRGGVLTVHEGERVAIVTREAVRENSLEELGQSILDRLRKEEDEEMSTQTIAARMEMAALRELERYLDAGTSRLPRAASPVARERRRDADGGFS
jgi:F-type H+-transporting ATPase subunit epsilon